MGTLNMDLWQCHRQLTKRQLSIIQQSRKQNPVLIRPSRMELLRPFPFWENQYFAECYVSRENRILQ